MFHFASPSLQRQYGGRVAQDDGAASTASSDRTMYEQAYTRRISTAVPDRNTSPLISRHHPTTDHSAPSTPPLSTVSRVPRHEQLGIHSEYCQHRQVVRLELEPLPECKKGISMVVKQRSDGASSLRLDKPLVDEKGALSTSPSAADDAQTEDSRALFRVSARSMRIVCQIHSVHEPARLLYSIEEKFFTTNRSHYLIKDAGGATVAKVKSIRTHVNDLAVSFVNRASRMAHERHLILKAGQSTVRLYEDSSIIAALSQPGHAFSADAEFTAIMERSSAPHCQLSVQPGLDTSLTLALFVCMYHQFINKTEFLQRYCW